MKNERGFTLIELLIVLAILGILVGIVAMSVGDLTDTAKRRGMQSEHSTVQTAIDTYLTQDVIVDGDTIVGDTAVAAADAQPGPAEVATYGFAKYLKRATKYYYTWTSLSATIGYTLTVEDAASPSLSYDGSNWTP